MDLLQVVGWTSYDSEYPTVDFHKHDQSEVMQATIAGILEEGLLFSGATHQNSEKGVPVFNEGTCLRCSMRAWANIMAASHGSSEYMSYYMDCEDEEVLSEKDLAVLPNEEEKDNGALPALIGPDQQMILESISMGFELMTTDKALLEMYPLYKHKFGK
ncbi:MAG: hypothetical protein K6B65_00155 [Bacilli bacterium]|nr:hypothetical protein [Bacilli bacterium]